MWKIKFLLNDAEGKAKLSSKWGWEQWTQQKPHFPEKTIWRSRPIKKKKKPFYIRKELNGGETPGKWKNYYECTRAVFINLRWSIKKTN